MYEAGANSKKRRPMMTAYYNEIDPYAAQWLRNLIEAGHIAPGVVDERSIEDVRPDELLGYTQCHFFAGVGVWSYALRLAGWPDDRKIWTASCPCQPFSSAGKGDGFNDERHLWPHLQWLIQQCKPAGIIGEQVASKDALPWIDLVHADLEAMGYAFGCVPFPSAGVGAPHLRDRAYWVAYLPGNRWEQSGPFNAWRDEKNCFGEKSELRNDGEIVVMEFTESERRGEARRGRKRSSKWAGECNESLRLGNSSSESSQRNAGAICSTETESNSKRLKDGSERNRHPDAGDALRVADATGERRNWSEGTARFAGRIKLETDGAADVELPGPTNGFWQAADWLHCRDGKWRPVRPGSFPLVNGTPSRVGRLRAYGNAINAEQAQIFIESVMEII